MLITSKENQWEMGKILYNETMILNLLPVFLNRSFCCILGIFRQIILVENGEVCGRNPIIAIRRVPRVSYI